MCDCVCVRERFCECLSNVVRMLPEILWNCILYMRHNVVFTRTFCVAEGKTDIDVFYIFLVFFSSVF